jgi:hypothetical protein
MEQKSAYNNFRNDVQDYRRLRNILRDIGGYLKARTSFRKRASGFAELIRVLKEESRDFIFNSLCKQAVKN